MTIQNILQNIPFFTHLTDDEIKSLCSIAEIKSVPTGERINIKSVKSLGVIIDGMFELGPMVKGEILYLAPGSFFGEIPFTSVRHTGSIKAVKDSKILYLNPVEIYKVFLSSYKGLKGYVKNIRKNGFEILDSADEFLKCNTKIISVFSSEHNSGNTLFSAALGLMLSANDSTIILDASYNGNSIFNLFGKDIPPAISQKSDESFTFDRIVKYTDNLSLFNISSGSKVKVDFSILSPVIFILSRKFKYVIIDHSDYEKDFTGSVFGVSDIIFSLLKSVKEKKQYEIFDSILKDGQRLFYVLNRFYAKDVGIFEGGYILEKIEKDENENILSHIEKQIKNENKQQLFKLLPDIILKKRTGLVVQTNLVDSILLSGFFSTLYEKDITIDFIYSSSWSYILTALYALSKDQKEYDANYLNFFNESRINNFLNITFPLDYVYKNNKIFNFAKELFGDKRIEHYSIVPASLLSEKQNCGQHQIFTTGYMKDIITASFLLDLFQPHKITDNFFYSGYPVANVKPEDLLRTDLDEIRCLSAVNKKRLYFKGKKMLKFYNGYIDGLDSKYFRTELSKTKNDFFIDINIDEYDPKEILTQTKIICKDMK